MKTVFECDVLVVPVLGRAITNDITGSFETINNSCPSEWLFGFLTSPQTLSLFIVSIEKKKNNKKATKERFFLLDDV